MTRDYARPELNPAEVAECRMVAQQISFRLSAVLRTKTIAALAAENMMLLKEVNQHRQFRGFDTLPVFKPKF